MYGNFAKIEVFLKMSRTVAFSDTVKVRSITQFYLKIIGHSWAIHKRFLMIFSKKKLIVQFEQTNKKLLSHKNKIFGNHKK